MSWQTACNDELKLVFDEAKTLTCTFPEPLRSRGLAYMEKFDPLVPGSAKNYICYSLPFWLREMAGADAAACRAMSLANVYVMLYFFLQDDLMDTVQAEWKEQLALANLYAEAFHDLYRDHFPAASPFWGHFRAYVREWAEAVATEGRAPLFPSDPLALARKAGPVKLASTGLLLLAGREALIPGVSELVDQTLVTLQMSDDWADWEEDLAEGCANSLLSFIRFELGLASDEPLPEELIRARLYLNGTLGRFAQRAADRHELLLPALKDAPLMAAFHAFLVTELQTAADRMERRKLSLKRGGFVDWLSENIKK